ncbi:AMP-binding enzyme, partial [Bacillus licheniformis]
LPVGIAGELCIAGEGVARGYVNRPELTAEKFVDHPFEPGKKMYKTGDLAMWLPDGQIEFLGRADHQVKIRGYRIELGEVEQQLLTHEKIKEAAVIAGKDQNGNSYLCAYIASDKELPAADVRQFLEREMPDYMIPSYFVKLDRLPRTPSGKV